ncbi:MAG: hypothetical protein KF773_23525 [Deltaproteobacteria bacterium]|nr:hypothetical protein [Deltaproteobacteria bacterium]
MKLAPAACLLLLGGCGLLFDASPAAHDAGADPDATPDAAPDAGACPIGAAPVTQRARTVADAVLIDPRGGTAQAFGRLPTAYLNYGGGIKSVGIWRFALADVTAPPATWIAARVVLRWLPADDDCSANCGACDAFEEQGTLELYPLRDQWDEQTVSWTARMAGTGWSEPGAAGLDRGPFAARATHTPREDLTFPLAGDGLAALTPWIAAQRLSVVVVPKADASGTRGARMIVPALPPRASCAPPDPPSYFEVDACLD